MTDPGGSLAKSSLFSKIVLKAATNTRMTTSQSYNMLNSGGDLRDADYSANLLNQYTNRVVPGAIDVFGSANSGATVTVNGASTHRFGALRSGKPV